MDHLFTLNEHTPKIKCIGRTGVDPTLLFGVDSKLFLLDSPGDHIHAQNDHDHHEHSQEGSQHDEVEVATILSIPDESREEPSGQAPGSLRLTREVLEQALTKLPKDVVYRVKGYVPLIRSSEPSSLEQTPASISSSVREDDGVETVILNWAFGRFETTPYVPDPLQSDNITQVSTAGSGLKLTIMGERGEIRRKWAGRLADSISGRVVLS